MKIKSFPSLGAALLAALSLTSVSCKDGSKATAEGGDNKAPAGNSGEASTKASKPASTPVAKQIVGHWAPDKDSLEALIRKGMEDGAAQMPPGFADKVIPAMVTAFADVFAFKLGEDTAWSISPDGFSEEGSYKIVTADESTGKFTVESTDKEDGTVEKNEGQVTGDTLLLTKEGVEMKMVRIDEANFEARKGKAASLDMNAIMAPIIQEMMGAAGGGLPPGFEAPEPQN